jgi:hypothetical protein|tara:strand:- start:896 stop:1450 length:555 start_codon:yes stop_codon:yes gene_type:complete
MVKNNTASRKGVYKDLDGWAGGPRSLTKVENSIKHDETHVTGNGRFAVDDYHVDPDIFAIAEANHEQYVQDRNEHEAKVVIAGLEAFVEEYNKHHDVSYETLRSKKYLANLTEDQKVGMRIKSTKYARKNKDKINKRAKEKYRTNKEARKKRAVYAKKYYEQNLKKPDLFKHEEWLKKRISGSY